MTLKQTRLVVPVLKVVLLVLSGSALAQPVTIAFTNVNVIPLDHEGVQPGASVLVRGDRIAEVGADVKVPPDAVVIDGAGQYLVPGLTDSHVHLPGTPVSYRRDDFGDAPLYLSYGVTTVVNMGGTPTILEWRRRIKAGTLLGPTIYTAGPFVNEPRVNTPDEVERDIVAQVQLGYDFIKFHELPRTTTGLSLSAYRRMAETARRLGIQLIGHAPVNLGIDEMLRERQSLAHIIMLDNIYFLPFNYHGTVFLVTAVATLILICLALASVAAVAIHRSSKRMLRSEPAAAAGSTSKLTTIIALTTTGAFVCVFAFLPGGPLFSSAFLRVAFTVLAGATTIETLIVGFSVVRAVRDAAVPRLRKVQGLLAVASAGAVTILMLSFWIPLSWRTSDAGIDHVAQRVHDAGMFVQSTLQLPSRGGRRRELLGWTMDRSFDQKVAGALHRNGVPIMAGTDAGGVPFIAPGSSLHRELQLLSASGLSPYEVMRSATVVPAAFLGRTKEFGTIAVGQRADLLLVAGNPLEDLAVLKRPIGVMVRGRWLPRQELDQLLERLATSE